MLLSNGALAPVSFADGQPSYSGSQVYYPNPGLALSNAFSTYGAVYKAQPWISALVMKIAYGAARLPLKVYRRDSDDGRTDARDTPLAALLRDPNPRHDPFFFWLWTVSTFEIYGEAIWIKVRPGEGRPPTQLWPMHPANVQTKRDDNGNLKYRYLFAGQQDKALEWDADDVVHFKSYNPDNQIRGLSRLEPLRQTILNEDASRRASAAMWSNGGRPSMALTSPKELSDPAIQRLSAQMNALHAGVDNWGKIAILEEGMTPTLFPLNASEMQYIEARQISREEACGVYDVPPPVVHILDHATFSNITEQMRSMYRDTMAPRLGLYESTMEKQLRPDFDPRGELYAEFLMDEVLRGAFEARSDAYQKASFMTIAEKRKAENLPFVDGTDRIFINMAEQPLSAPATDDAPAAPPFQTVGLPALIAAGVIDPQDARELLGIEGVAPGPVEPQDAPSAALNSISADVCRLCKASGPLSATTGLCRKCGGPAGRNTPKENPGDA